jgi:hypothetical protein
MAGETSSRIKRVLSLIIENGAGIHFIDKMSGDPMKCRA